MSSTRVYRKNKKVSVQLTSLLDLLFVMIFVSLIQEKAPSKAIKEPTKATPTVTAKAIPVKKKEIKPAAPTKYNISAIFHFHPTAGSPNLPSGTYVMQGSFNEKTREIKLAGVSWVNRPTGYDMVPLSGTIESTNTLFKGRVDFPGCQLFTLKRMKTISNSPISGKWEGIYDCSQGPTGLTLTIQ
jgi:hypothetical protein